MKQSVRWPPVPAGILIGISMLLAWIVAGRGISRIIEASERGLPALANDLEVYSLPAEEKAKFKAAALPVIKEHIEETFGAEGVEMMNAFIAAIEAGK